MGVMNEPVAPVTTSSSTPAWRNMDYNAAANTARPYLLEMTHTPLTDFWTYHIYSPVTKVHNTSHTENLREREHLWTLLSVVEVVKPGHGVPPAKDRRVDGVDPLRLSTLALLVITRG